MSRRGADLPPAEQLRALIGANGSLAVRVTPAARSEGIAIEDGRGLVRVRARPQDGAANAAVCRLVARTLSLPTARVRLLRGATSREKLLGIML